VYISSRLLFGVQWIQVVVWCTVDPGCCLVYISSRLLFDVQWIQAGCCLMYSGSRLTCIANAPPGPTLFLCILQMPFAK